MPSKAVEHWIILGNIARFEEQLERVTDEEIRTMLRTLLSQEKAKLDKAIK